MCSWETHHILGGDDIVSVFQIAKRNNNGKRSNIWNLFNGTSSHTGLPTLNADFLSLGTARFILVDHQKIVSSAFQTICVMSGYIFYLLTGAEKFHHIRGFL